MTAAASTGSSSSSSSKRRRKRPGYYKDKYPHLNRKQLRSLLTRRRRVPKAEMQSRQCCECGSSHTNPRKNKSQLRIDRTPVQSYPYWYRSKDQPGKYMCYTCAHRLITQRLSLNPKWRERRRKWAREYYARKKKKKMKKN
jgi:hypothetical protein